MFIVYAIIIFALLIFVHELGHLLSAKSVGIRVKEFAIGMGPILWSVTRGETRYSVRPFPIGGFCAMEGEDEESDDPRAFNKRPAPARAFVLVAGSGMNILLAILMISLLIFAQGEPTTTIGTITEDSPAAQTELKTGDRILEVDGKTVASWDEIRAALTAAAEPAGAKGMDNGVKSQSGAAQGAGDAATQEQSGATQSGGDAATQEQKSTKSGADMGVVPTVNLLVRSPDGSQQAITAAMYKATDGAFRVGISPTMERGSGFFFRSFELGGKAIWNMAGQMYQALGQLVTGQAGIDQLTGPVGIVKAVGDGASAGGSYVIQLAALISLNLGIVNLLPFPALDGGRILFLVIRLFTGKRVSDKVERYIHAAGMIALFGFMIFITFADVRRLIFP